VSVFTIYVGGDLSKYARFNSYIEGALHHSSNFKEAILKLRSEYNHTPLMILFEKGDRESDREGVALVKREFPAAYIIVVADNLDKEEIKWYLRCGVNDTAISKISKTRLLNGIDFVARNQELILAASAEHKPLGKYKCPVWKRIFDIIGSLLLLLLLSPFLIIILLLILTESRGPAIYKSKRVGSNYKQFDFYKFRSMYRDADKRLKEFMSLNQYKEAGPEIDYDSYNSLQLPVEEAIADNLFVSDDNVISEVDYQAARAKKARENFVKYENDPRITKVGRFLRKYSIDELPQLINIFKGDMSLVGNRPLPLYEAEQLTSDKYIDRFLAPAGLTGLWQVEKRGDSGRLSPEERKQLDLYYAKHYNLMMDIRIIFKTLTAIVQKENV